MNYEAFRREYTAGGLTAGQLQDNPVSQFKLWLAQAVESGIPDPTAMVLGTVDDALGLWQRIVLCKGVDERGFSFFTNYQSNKANAIAQNARVSLLFPWNAIDRQVIVSGTVSKLDEAASASYFASRPRGSQIAAWASQQSQPVDDRSALEAEVARLSAEFDGGDVPLPPFWGGYVVEPLAVEFWQGRENRLHDRFRYLRSEVDGTACAWQVVQLQP